MQEIIARYRRFCIKFKNTKLKVIFLFTEKNYFELEFVIKSILVVSVPSLSAVQQEDSGLFRWEMNCEKEPRLPT